MVRKFQEIRDRSSRPGLSSYGKVNGVSFGIHIFYFLCHLYPD